MHELGHATGHPVADGPDGNFGSTEYAREELRAEMSAMMTGERVGVGHDGSRGAAYVEGVKALEDDPKEIYKAAADRRVGSCSRAYQSTEAPPSMSPTGSISRETRAAP